MSKFIHNESKSIDDILVDVTWVVALLVIVVLPVIVMVMALYTYAIAAGNSVNSANLMIVILICAPVVLIGLSLKGVRDKLFNAVGQLRRKPIWLIAILMIVGFALIGIFWH